MSLAGRLGYLVFILSFTIPANGDDCALPDIASIKQKYPKAHEKCLVFINQTDECCRDPKKSGCGLAPSPDVLDRVNPPTDGPSGAAITETKNRLRSANESYKAHAACSMNVRKTTADKWQGCDYYGSTSQDPEEKKQTLALNEEIKRAYKRPVDCLKDRANKDENDADKALNSYYSSTTDGHYKFNCMNKKFAGEESRECYLLDVNQTGGEYVPNGDAPVTTARTTKSGCTALIGYNSASDADHCRDGSDVKMEMRNGAETRIIEGTNGKALPFEEKNGNTLPTGRYDDLRVFKTAPDETAKPHFNLGVSDWQEGCAEHGFMVQCSTKALLAYNGNAMVQGYPITHYPANSDGSFSAPDNVLVTRGPAFYDRDNQTFYVNAYSYKGNSGGPVVIPAGTEIGGLTLSKPLVIGNVSGYSWNGQESSNPAGNRTMTIVPVYSYDRVTQMYIQSVPESLLRSGGGVFK